jgi:hypothetical protein
MFPYNNTESEWLSTVKKRIVKHYTDHKKRYLYLSLFMFVVVILLALTLSFDSFYDII